MRELVELAPARDRSGCNAMMLTLAAMFLGFALAYALGLYLPPRPADAPVEPDYSQPGVLEHVASKAGLDPESAFDSTWSYEFPDEDTVRRALVAPAGLAVLVGPDREDEAKDAIVNGIARYRTTDGGYRLQNNFHSLIGRAR